MTKPNPNLIPWYLPYVLATPHRGGSWAEGTISIEPDGRLHVDVSDIWHSGYVEAEDAVRMMRQYFAKCTSALFWLASGEAILNGELIVAIIQHESDGDFGEVDCGWHVIWILCDPDVEKQIKAEVFDTEADCKAAVAKVFEAEILQVRNQRQALQDAYDKLIASNRHRDEFVRQQLLARGYSVDMNQTGIDEALAALDAARESLEQALYVLRLIEWEMGISCPCCQGIIPEHFTGCEIADVLHPT